MLVVSQLAEIEASTGRQIVLALEPEPDCLWDRTSHLVELFRETLPRLGYARLRDLNPRSAGAAVDEQVSRYLGVCLDTCHQSVLFDRPEDALTELLAHNVAVAKVQISAAPVFDCSDAGLEAAETFVDSCYLHQCCIRCPDSSLIRFPDLPEALEAARSLPCDAEFRTHFHIPLVAAGGAGFTSTRNDLSDRFWKLVQGMAGTHVEVETYSFGVLPPALRALTVEESIARELQWTRARLASREDAQPGVSPRTS